MTDLYCNTDKKKKKDERIFEPGQLVPAHPLAPSIAADIYQVNSLISLPYAYLLYLVDVALTGLGFGLREC